MLRLQCQQFGVFDEFLSVDESTAPYKGLHSTRQILQNKPVRSALKYWMLYGSSGYPYIFDIHCGKDSNRKEPMGTCIVNKMLTAVTEVDNHVVFFDNYFTSYQLMSELYGRNIRACGMGLFAKIEPTTVL